MPYFINVGVFKGLKSGVGARGWRVWRREKVIHVHFGPIEVSDRYPKRFRWARGPTKQKFSERSIEAARKEMQRRIDEKRSKRRANGDKEYQELPPGHRILAKRSGRRQLLSG
jgi:hypothetical protein